MCAWSTIPTHATSCATHPKSASNKPSVSHINARPTTQTHGTPMLSRSYLRILFAISCVALAMTLGACGSKQDAKSSSQSHASTSKSEDTPDLKGDELKVCNEYKRSEEHTSELQSRGHLVCRLLLEKKTNIK